MPFRPKKKVRIGKRPAWNTEPDYYVREKARLKLVEAIRERADSFRELPHQCLGCDFRIWEARTGDMVYRGCHCTTMTLAPGHRLYDFDPQTWSEAIEQLVVPATSPAEEDVACVRSLARLRPTVRDDPFAVAKGALAGHR